jgi:hypothetical protein
VLIRRLQDGSAGTTPLDVRQVAGLIQLGLAGPGGLPAWGRTNAPGRSWVARHTRTEELPTPAEAGPSWCWDSCYAGLRGPTSSPGKPLDLACRQDVITAGFPSLQTLVIMRCVNRQPSAVRRSRSS